MSTPDRRSGDSGETLSRRPTEGSEPAAGEGTTLAPKDEVAGRYRILRLLGRGGMGEVYEAEDLELSVPVALKTIRPQVAARPGALRRFKREVLLGRAVTHPNVCRVFDIGQDRKRRLTYLTMELLKGETLAHRLREEGRLSPAETLPLARQMAEALEAAHRAGVVHRDLKCSNVMLVPGAGGERAVVTDFGLSWAATPEEQAEELTQAGMAMGTPTYMAPEQMRGAVVGPAADLYSFGVVLFKTLTGELPYSGQSPAELAKQHLAGAPPSPRGLVADLDPRWEAVILSLLRPRPQERPARAREALAPLQPGYVETKRVRHTLPAECDAFVGRQAELEELERRLAGGTRMLTLLGAGGTGKTRLAVRFGWGALASYSGGVWFVDLSEARSADGILSAVAASLEVPLGTGDPVAQLGHAIAGRGRCLMVLDNFEQVVDEAPRTLGAWLELAAEATFLVTSRERLRLAGEEVLPLEPLPAELEGVELFALRAVAQRPGFSLEENREAVRRVVRLVDGLPLAIELAAARVRLLSVEQILARLEAPLQLLVGGRPAPARHETLRATLDWSWELLRPWERAALAQLAVFEGGFTLEASEAVVELAGRGEVPHVLDVVQALLDKSLLRRLWERGEAEETVEPRFGMYGSIQQYVREKLGGEPDQERAAELRHGQFCARFGSEEALAALDGHGGVARHRRLTRELDNLIVAAERAFERGDAPVAAAAYLAAWQVLAFRGPFSLALELGSRVETMEGLSEAQRSSVLKTRGRAAQLSGRGEDARRHYEDALALARRAGARRTEGLVLAYLAALHSTEGRKDEALQCHEAALEVIRAGGYRVHEVLALSNLGLLHYQQSQFEEARRCYEAALPIAQEVGARRREGVLLCNLGMLHTIEHRLAEARECLEAGAAIARELGDHRLVGFAFGVLADLHCERDPEEARRCYEAALASHREMGDRRLECSVLGHLGILNADQGRLEEARACHEAALPMAREVGARRIEGGILGNLGPVAFLQGSVAEARECYEAALAIHRDLGDRLLEGAALENLGSLHLEEGRLEEARRLMEEALAIAREVGGHLLEGRALTDLGDLLLRSGALDEARDALAAGEPLLREAGERLELAMLLSVRSRLEQREGEAARARATLAEAESLASELGAGPRSALGRLLDRARQSHA